MHVTIDLVLNTYGHKLSNKLPYPLHLVSGSRTERRAYKISIVVAWLVHGYLFLFVRDQDCRYRGIALLMTVHSQRTSSVPGQHTFWAVTIFCLEVVDWIQCRWVVTSCTVDWRRFVGGTGEAVSGQERTYMKPQLGVHPLAIVGQRFRHWLLSQWLERLPTSWSWRTKTRATPLSTSSCYWRKTLLISRLLIKPLVPWRPPKSDPREDWIVVPWVSPPPPEIEILLGGIPETEFATQVSEWRANGLSG